MQNKILTRKESRSHPKEKFRE